MEVCDRHYWVIIHLHLDPALFELGRMTERDLQCMYRIILGVVRTDEGIDKRQDWTPPIKFASLSIHIRARLSI